MMSPPAAHRRPEPCTIARRGILHLCAALAWAGGTGTLAAAEGPTILTIEGAVRRPGGEREVHFDVAALALLPQRRIRTTTPWHVGEPVFAGPLLRDVLAAAGADGSSLRLRALNDYRVDIPVDDARRYDVIVAHQVNGQAITVRDKGPLFVMYPFDRHPELRNSVYFSRCIWQLRHIECS